MARVTYKFEGCLLDLKRKQFYRNGELTALEPRCYDVLSYLVTHRDRIVKKDELIDEVWKTIVSDTALTRCVMKLRKAIGDDPRNPSIIRTVQKSGYHFIAEVSEGHTDIKAEPKSVSTAQDLSKPSIAVLPFENLSAAQDQDYFADGITEDIITSLASWRWFPVISRQSTFHFRDKAMDAADVGRELGARYVVEGSVRRSGDRVRISARLTDSTTSLNLWAGNFDGNLDDVFALQDEIAEKIVTCVEPEIARAEQQRIVRRPPENLDAWEKAIRALALLQSGKQSGLTDAKGLLEQSIELDPSSSYARSLLALVLFTEILSDWTNDPTAAGDHFLSAAEKAIEIDGRDWLAHALHGLAMLIVYRDSVLAEESGRTAVALNPSAATAHQFLGCILSFSGNPIAAIDHLNTTLKLNPRHDRMYLLMADLALCNLLVHDLDAAVDYGRKAIQSNPADVRARQRLVSALGHQGDETAAAELKDLLRLQPGFSMAYIEATYPFRLEEHLDYFLQGLEKAGWK